MRLNSLAATSIALALAATMAGAGATRALVMKDPNCGCCTDWMTHLQDNGFAPEASHLAPGALAQAKAQHGVPVAMASCHTALIDGYVIEGHVPAADILRLLETRPDAVGLAVPGMPMGSPGMDYGDARDAYEVLLIGRDGTTTPFASYPAN